MKEMLNSFAAWVGFYTVAGGTFCCSFMIASKVVYGEEKQLILAFAISTAIAFCICKMIEKFTKEMNNESK